MRIEITIVDEQDQDDVRHILTCEEHEQEFYIYVSGLLFRATHVSPPATVHLDVRSANWEHNHAD